MEGPTDEVARPRFAPLLCLGGLIDFAMTLVTLAAYTDSALLWLALTRALVSAFIGASSRARRLHVLLAAACLCPLVAALYTLNAAVQHHPKHRNHPEESPHPSGQDLLLQLGLSLFEWMLYIGVVGISVRKMPYRRRRTTTLPGMHDATPEEPVGEVVDEDAITENDEDSELDDDDLVDIPATEGDPSEEGSSTWSMEGWRLSTPTRRSIRQRTSSGYGTL